MNILKFLRSEGCPWDPLLCLDLAIKYRHKDVMDWIEATEGFKILPVTDIMGREINIIVDLRRGGIVDLRDGARYTNDTA